MNLSEQRIGALAVRHLAMIPAVVEFRNVPLQVLLAYMVERADKAALQQAETGLDRIRVVDTVNVLAGTMTCHAM